MDPSSDPQAHWVAACRAGELETAQSLWATDEVHLTHQLWIAVCATEHLSMVQWLSSLEPTPSPENGWVEACASGQLENAQWLWTMERETADGWPSGYSTWASRRRRSSAPSPATALDAH